jgi:hypothetical protein
MNNDLERVWKEAVGKFTSFNEKETSGTYLTGKSTSGNEGGSLQELTLRTVLCFARGEPAA